MNKKLLGLPIFVIALAAMIGFGAINVTKALSDDENESQSTEGAYPYGHGYGNLGGES